MIIETQDQLNDLCARLSAQAYLTIDTEFLRDKTYYPKLCLLQLAGPGIDPAAVDPISTNLDWAPLHNLLSNENVIKVFHAARQDLEIFYQLTGTIPHPIFDTQVAAMVCGYGDQVAYHALVKGITDHQLAKNAQFTDWSRRPLSKKQMAYALDDVIYLRDVYESLATQLESKDRESWVKEEMAILTDPDTYINPPEDAWKRIKIRTDKREALAILQALAAWREAEAQRRDIPRGRVIRDEALADIAVYMPKNTEGLLRIRNVPGDVSKGKTGEKLLSLVAQARETPSDTWPKPIRKAPFNKDAAPVLEMLKMLLKINCAQEHVAPKLVATSDDLEQLATEDTPDIPALKGWRGDIFGQDAIAMKNGKLALSIENGQIKKRSL